MKHDALVARAADNVVDEMPWGRLAWMVSGPIGNSTAMTVGRCHISPGQANPRHYHSNCDEIVQVLSGTIVHTLDDEEFTMSVGDTVSIPAGTVHNARNIGEEPAVLALAFSSAYREVAAE